MTYQEHFKEELNNQKTQYFILDTKGGNEHGDIDFVQYQWSRSQFNKVEEGDVCIFRRPGKASETGKFYFFGAAKIGAITGDTRVIGLLEKPYPFQEFIHQNDLNDFEWTWKQRGNTWEHFFNQYGMNQINKFDFENLLSYSDSFTEEGYSADAATEAIQNIQIGNYYVDDEVGKVKVRSKQRAFSNTVKANYGNKCCFCLLSTKHFLVGSHIVPWAARKETRLDPSNGLCLCSFHDKAFDKGYVTISNDYRLIVTRRNTQDAVLSGMLEILHGTLLHLPRVSRSNTEFLRYHRDNIFDRF